MRLAADFPDERKAYTYCQMLEQKGINASYEAAGPGHNCVWIIEEDEFEQARAIYDEFTQLPEEQQRKVERLKGAKGLPGIIPGIGMKKEAKGNFTHVRLRPGIRIPKRSSHPMTNCLLIICSLLFFWNLLQETNLVKSEGKIALQIGLTPLQEDLMYDYPNCFSKLEQLLKQYPLSSVDEINTLPTDARKSFSEAEKCSYWKGAYEFIKGHVSKTPTAIASAAMFEKIREGQVWRLFTPSLLHRDLLHIIFNMSWLIYLGRQIEERLGKWKFLSLVVIIGILSNTAQYLMSGPYFLGFSGVAVGLAGFIWMRQRVSPWEGYPLSAGTMMFLVIFIAAMLLLDWISLAMHAFGKTPFTGAIANTAHISGGIIGILLARLSIFAHKTSS